MNCSSLLEHMSGVRCGLPAGHLGRHAFVPGWSSAGPAPVGTRFRMPITAQPEGNVLMLNGEILKP